MSFNEFWHEVRGLASRFGGAIVDREAWRARFGAGLSAIDAYFSEYPEQKPQWFEP